MSIKIRAAAVICLAAAAAALAVTAVRGVSASGEGVPDYYTEAAAEPEGTQYVLRDYGGYICVYAPGAAKKPRTVTDIETALLREGDRRLLKSGIPVSSEAELLALLEDFGS